MVISSHLHFLTHARSTGTLCQGCWHNLPTGRVIFTQNVTFNKFPGQNIRGEWRTAGLSLSSAVRVNHYLPSGNYQLAMVPYIKVTRLVSMLMEASPQTENGTFVAIAPPSCSARLERINLGRHGLTIIFSRDPHVCCSYACVQFCY